MRTEPGAPPPAEALYYDSLQALAAHRPSSRRHAAPSLPLAFRPPNRQRRLLVCHDYQGGYQELKRAHQRDYTHLWLLLVSTFVYFSHHRVSLPPPSWIRTAHRHGTKILGTLIFEWEQGTEDIMRLLSPTEKGYDELDTSYADLLVDLAVEKGFEGWLINIEVALPGGEAQASLLSSWLDYLTRETQRRIPGGEIIWYDAVTTRGELRWQDRVTPLNKPFLNASNGIFLNYTWSPSFPGEMRAQMGDKVTNVYVGLDVWGRGQYGGGGFESWRSLDMIEGAADRTSHFPTLAPPPTALSTEVTPPPASPPSLSTALFAPAWTVESDNLQHTLSTRAGYARWLADERYLWYGGDETSTVLSERRRLYQARLNERGVQRARQLAKSTSAGLGGIEPRRFEYTAPLPDYPLLPHRPIASFFPVRPPICSSFYSSWASGSGFDFYVEGSKVYESDTGWTDIESHYPAPDRISASASAVLTESDAWLGAACVEVTHAGGTAYVDLCSTHFVGGRYSGKVVWKSSGEGTQVEMCLGMGGMSAAGGTTILVGAGWNSTEVELVVPEGYTDDGLGINISSTLAATILVGALSLTPRDRRPLPTPKLHQLHFDRSSSDPGSGYLRWSVAYLLSARVPIDTSVGLPVAPDSKEPYETYLFYTIWRASRSGGGMAFLGTTAATEFWVTAARDEVLVVRGVRIDGSLDSFESAARLELSAARSVQ